MSGFKTAIALENEIMKAHDFTFGYDSSISNVAEALKAVLSNSAGNYVIGGKVKPYSSGGLNVSIEPIYVYENSTQMCAAETKGIEPVSFERADDTFNRIDIIQVCAVETAYDIQSRKFNDPATGVKTTRTVATKKRMELKVSVKKGSTGSASAPLADPEWVKIAEVVIPAGAVNIKEDAIRNITARKFGVPNEKWTADKEAVFNPGYLADVIHQFLVSHNEDGTHKQKVLKVEHIDFGTATEQVKGLNIPLGEDITLCSSAFPANENLTKIISALANETHNLYEYANDILSRFEFVKNNPVAASTKNVDVKAGGAMTIDGVSVSAGQLVFLKDQKDAKENGFWEVQTGAWNRYKGFESPYAFVNKLIFIKTGTANKGKVFYINSDFKTGIDELIFKECKATPYVQPFTAIVRDKDGRAKISAPKENDDIARQKEVDEALSNAKSYTESYTAGEIKKINTSNASLNGKLNDEIKARKDGDISTLINAKSYTDDILIKILKNGYIQWDGMDNPSTIYLPPRGYEWKEIFYATLPKHMGWECTSGG